MADYLPKFTPGQAVTFTASAAVTGGQAVEITGARSVGPTAAASRKYIGIAAFSAAAGAKVTVHLPGQVQRIKAAGAITAGATVQTGAAGTVAAGTTAPIGLALTAATAPGDLVEVLDSIVVTASA